MYLLHKYSINYILIYSPKIIDGNIRRLIIVVTENFQKLSGKSEFTFRRAK